MNTLKESNQRLIKEYIETKSKKAFDQLIIDNQSLVYHAMKKEKIPVDKRDDFFDLGIICLIRAINTYKMEFIDKCSLSTYALNLICRGFHREFDIQRRHVLKADVSLDKKLEGGISEFYDIIYTADQRIEPDVTELVERSDYSRYLNKQVMLVVDGFESFDREVFVMYYGLGDGKPMTQTDIAKKFNLTKAEISRRIVRCNKILKEALKYNYRTGELNLTSSIKGEVYVRRAYTDRKIYNEIMKVINDLPFYEQEILLNYYELDDNIKLSVNELSQKYGVSAGKIRRLISNNLLKIEKHFEKQVNKIK